MNIKNRLKKMELLAAKEDSEFCAKSCRKAPEIIITHMRDGVDCPEPEWYGKANGVKDHKKPILQFCYVCGKPTRKQTIAINWVTDTRQ